MVSKDKKEYMKALESIKYFHVPSLDILFIENNIKGLERRYLVKQIRKEAFRLQCD